MSIKDRNKPVLVVAALLVSGFVVMHSAIANAWSRTTPQIAVAQLGGTGRDTALSMVLDGSGNTFITGWFSGTVDFDPGVGIKKLKSASDYGSFVSKLDRSGNFVWAKQIGGTTALSKVVLDGSGNIYIIGWYEGTVDFDPGVGIENLKSAGIRDDFVLKLDRSGKFVWVRQIGGARADLSRGSAVLDGSGNIYITGAFNRTVDFDPGEGIYNLTNDGRGDGYLLKLDRSGKFVWVRQITDLWAISVAVDGSGNIYITAGGEFRSCAAKFDGSGNLMWSKCLSPISWATAMNIDGSGNIYITGAFIGTVDFDPGEGIYNLTSSRNNGDEDLYVLKLDGSGNFVWVKQVGGVPQSRDYRFVALDGSGNIYIFGVFQGTVDFDTGEGTNNLKSAGDDDVFVLKLDSSGNFIRARQVGGKGSDKPSEVSLDESGNIYIIGEFQSTVDFDPGEGTNNLKSAGEYDVFVLKLDAAGEVVRTKR